MVDILIMIVFGVLTIRTAKVGNSNYSLASKIWIAARLFSMTFDVIYTMNYLFWWDLNEICEQVAIVFIYAEVIFTCYCLTLSYWIYTAVKRMKSKGMMSESSACVSLNRKLSDFRRLERLLSEEK